MTSVVKGLLIAVGAGLVGELSLELVRRAMHLPRKPRWWQRLLLLLVFLVLLLTAFIVVVEVRCALGWLPSDECT